MRPSSPRRYLGELGVEKVETATPGESIHADLLVSYYACSECTRRVQRLYIDKVVSHAHSGYMTCNFLEGMRPDELVARVLGSRRIEEQPLTAKENAILVWGDSAPPADR